MLPPSSQEQGGQAKGTVILQKQSHVWRRNESINITVIHYNWLVRLSPVGVAFEMETHHMFPSFEMQSLTWQHSTLTEVIIKAVQRDPTPPDDGGGHRQTCVDTAWRFQWVRFVRLHACAANTLRAAADVCKGPKPAPVDRRPKKASGYNPGYELHAQRACFKLRYKTRARERGLRGVVGEGSTARTRVRVRFGAQRVQPWHCKAYG